MRQNTHTDQTTRDGKLQIVVLGEERHDPAEDRLGLDLALLVLGDNTRPDLNLVAELEHTSENRATSNTSLELLDLRAGLVDVEGTDDNHVRSGREVAYRHWNLRHEVFVDGINVELQLGRDRDDGRAISDSATDELQNRLVVLLSALFPHKIDLVLEDDDVVKLHNFNGSQVLRRLRLRASFWASSSVLTVVLE